MLFFFFSFSFLVRKPGYLITTKDWSFKWRSLYDAALSISFCSTVMRKKKKSVIEFWWVVMVLQQVEPCLPMNDLFYIKHIKTLTVCVTLKREVFCKISGGMLSSNDIFKIKKLHNNTASPHNHKINTIWFHGGLSL